MAAKGKKANVVEVAKPQAEAVVVVDSATDVAGPFVGQWNRLVSTTNWEKGRIICQWRDALIAGRAAVTDYSDEAWSQLVGGVTSQHVGRLRRVYQRFGEVFDQYDRLYWSHFQAALDWQDAEMWLEGAIHNGWSVSQMRGKRWETVGKPGEAMPADELSDADEANDHAPWPDQNAVTAGSAAAESIETPTRNKSSDEQPADMDGDEPRAHESNGAASGDSPKTSAKSHSRLAVEVDELPRDIADAFEQFKLAIIAQRRLGWTETTPATVIECLDALRQLALAPPDA